MLRLSPAVNRRTDDPHRYLIAPDDLRQLEREVREAGQEVVGYYHSHPDHPAAPSAFDAEHAWPWYSYLIVRIDRGRGGRHGQLGAGRRASPDASRIPRRSQRGVTMSVTVSIPTPLRSFTGGRDAVEVAGATVGQVLDELLAAHTGLKRHLVQDDGRLRTFVNLYLNDTDIRQLASTATPVAEGDVLTIVPSIAGGSPGDRNRAPKLSHAEVLRYSRHLLLPEVGVEGQRKLKAARVLTIGAGGLGSPLSLYLAAAGVGTIGIVDFDVVDLTNLQRQIVHGTSTLGHRSSSRPRRG